MAKPIYKMFLVKFREAWYQLSVAEKEAIMEKVSASHDKVKAKAERVCECRWAGEAWDVFGVEVFPDIEAVQQHDRNLEAIHWFRYVETMTTLGTEMPGA